MQDADATRQNSRRRRAEKSRQNSGKSAGFSNKRQPLSAAGRVGSEKLTEAQLIADLFFLRPCAKLFARPSSQGSHIRHPVRRKGVVRNGMAQSTSGRFSLQQLLLCTASPEFSPASGSQFQAGGTSSSSSSAPPVTSPVGTNRCRNRCRNPRYDVGPQFHFQKKER